MSKRDVVDAAIHKPPNLLLTSLRQLRYDVLMSGLPPDERDGGECRYRHYVWSILLQIDLTDAVGVYSELVSRGPSVADKKIRSDSFRTLATDKKFKQKVAENSLLRVLNAYIWNTPENPFYVQGMNVLCAPFLYVAKTESQAFCMLNALLHDRCPLYVASDLNGVHTGVRLVNLVLELTDPKLYKKLKQKLLTAEVYGLASVMTLSACTPPLSELLQLWDLYLAYGCSLNIIAVVAQVIDIRNELMTSERPASRLRKMPLLNFQSIKERMLGILKHIPPQLFDLIRRHPFDPEVPRQLDQWMQTKDSPQ
ncbi:Bub2 protein [Starmerella bacillaris]|uniref:Bub2 protein n=1 Tax=Starmerella bacillaris TaxID=1247836 RepID=A0AAV5RQ97_STABA|nr:Bub2 protein [Starmerella bacillaris]